MDSGWSYGTTYWIPVAHNTNSREDIHITRMALIDHIALSKSLSQEMRLFESQQFLERNLRRDVQWLKERLRTLGTEFVLYSWAGSRWRNVTGWEQIWLWKDGAPALPRYRVVTALAAPFVRPATILWNGTCLLGVPCLQVDSHYPDDIIQAFRDARNRHPSPRYNATCCAGIAIDLLNSVARDLAFDFDLYLVADGSFGANRGRGWTGVTRDLMSGAAHLAFTAFSITSGRSRVIDFSVPYFHSGVSCLTYYQYREAPLYAFLVPFSVQLWVAIFGSLTITAIAAASYEWVSPFGLNPWGRQRTKNFTLASALWVMWSLLFSHLVAFKAPKSWPNKVLINLWGCFSVIFLASYTANIAALFAGLSFNLRVDDFHDASVVGALENSLPNKQIVEALTAGVTYDLKKMIYTRNPQTPEEWLDYVNTIQKWPVTSARGQPTPQRDLDCWRPESTPSSGQGHYRPQYGQAAFRRPGEHYYDDFIIFSDSFEEHLEHLRLFFQLCRAENIRLNLNKCQLCKTSISFLGYEITQGTYKPHLTNTQVIGTIQPPTNVKTLQSFLGVVNVYHKFIPHYAQLRSPLNILLKKNIPFKWTLECQKAFEDLKSSLTASPVLHIFKEDLPCFLYCDASTLGISGILKQKDENGEEHPVQYFSRSLRKYEQNYSISELECLAIIESIEYFRVYLLGRHFTIYSDHQALVYLKNIKNPSGGLFRWSLRLSPYTFDIHYLKGKKQLEADLLSRQPFCGFLEAQQLEEHQHRVPEKYQSLINTDGLAIITKKGVPRVVVPDTLRNKLLQKAHEWYNHPGITQLTRLITSQYYWDGDLVLVKVHRHPNTPKLEPNYTGPYEILEILSPQVVRINRPNRPLQLQTEIINIEKLRRYVENIPHITPPTDLPDSPPRRNYFLFPYRHFTTDILGDSGSSRPRKWFQPFNHLDNSIFTDERFYKPDFPITFKTTFSSIWWRCWVPKEEERSIRRSRRLQGLTPDNTATMNNRSEATTQVSPLFCQNVVRNPSMFSGEISEDPQAWLKGYERVARHNHWDDSLSLANVYFYLHGTAQRWYENNEENIPSWEIFKDQLGSVFGKKDNLRRQAEQKLKVRAQTRGETTEFYIQDVLRLCREVDAQMPEEERLSHLMKGVAEEVYRYLLPRDIATTDQFIAECRRVVALQGRRVTASKFERLPNVTSLGDLGDVTDLQSLIRQIVREEVQRALAPPREEPRISSLEEIVKEEVDKVLAPMSGINTFPMESAARSAPRNYRKNTWYAPKVEASGSRVEVRDTNEWRTPDGTPVCFHCGRPGHVVRYCRDRRRLLDERRDEMYQDRARTMTNSGRNNNSNDADQRVSTRRYRSPSPSPRRGSSPGRSATRRASQSPRLVKMTNNYIDIKVEGDTIRALVDSGASYSVISERFRVELKKTMFAETDVVLKVADDKVVKSKGRCTLKLEVNGHPENFEFVVLENCSHDVILGWDFFKATNAVIDCGLGELQLDDLPDLDAEGRDDGVYAIQDFVIPGRSSQRISVVNRSLVGIVNMEVTCSKELFIRKDVIFPSSLIEFEEGIGKIWITNGGLQPQMIPKGMNLGVFLPTMKNANKVQNRVKHRIHTGDHPPIKQRPYRVSKREREIMQKEVDTMLERKVIQPSESPWSAPVVLVKKKDGTWRFCVDFRRLNHITKKDVYPLPRIDDVLDHLSSARYYSTMDLKTGYWQVEVDERDREKTAFVTPDGLYEFMVMPFGLCNAPATFERMMDNVLMGLKWNICLCYLDDIVVYSDTFEEHLERLSKVLSCLQQAGLTINPDKCLFGSTRIKILGHVVDKDGIQPDSEKVEAIKKFPVPKSVCDIQSYLGLCSYYRRFIKNFSKIAAPLQILLKKDQKFIWTQEQKDSFESLKKALMQKPVLGHFKESAITKLHTDASSYGLGAVLVQIQENQENPIAYASRTLSKAEKNYSTTERECLAVIWAIGKFRPYLYGRPFEVVSDHHSLCWLAGLKDPSGRLARWALKLQDFEATITYKSGVKHKDADCLSRYPLPESPALTSLTLVREQQNLDPDITKISNALNQGEGAERFEMKNGLLYKRNFDPLGRRLLLVIPKCMRPDILKEFHDVPTAGHLGFARTYDRIRKRYFWPGLYNSVRRYVAHCKECQRRKGENKLPAGKLIPIKPPSFPFQKIGMDLLGRFPLSDKGNRWIIVCTDYLTKYAIAKALPSGTAAEIATFILEEVILKHGAPREIITDRGRAFMSQMVKEVTSRCKISHLFTTAYHPQTNGLTERLNKTLGDMLSMYVDAEQRDWDSVLPYVIFAYNTAQQGSTRFSPFFLVHGREAETLLDVLLPYEDETSDHDFGDQMVTKAEEARQLARIHILRAQENNKYHYDQVHRSVEYRVGDLVWVFTPVRKTGLSEKLLKKYFGPYKITRKVSEVNYEVEALEQSSRRRRRSQKDVVHVLRMKPYRDPGQQLVTGDYNSWDSEDAVDILEGGLRGDLDVLIGDTAILDFYRGNDPGCNLHLLGEAIFDDSYAIGMQKGLPLKLRTEKYVQGSRVDKEPARVKQQSVPGSPDSGTSGRGAGRADTLPVVEEEDEEPEPSKSSPVKRPDTLNLSAPKRKTLRRQDSFDIREIKSEETQETPKGIVKSFSADDISQKIEADVTPSSDDSRKNS
ncbi:hypothetical protein LAZ67_13002577, partial [Cordylochernes scorpioides]